MRQSNVIAATLTAEETVGLIGDYNLAVGVQMSVKLVRGAHCHLLCKRKFFGNLICRFSFFFSLKKKKSVMICFSYVACCGTRPWHQYENTKDHSGRMRQRGAKHANKQQNINCCSKK